jgi:hypothetical protein
MAPLLGVDWINDALGTYVSVAKEVDSHTFPINIHANAPPCDRGMTKGAKRPFSTMLYSA